MSSGTQWEIVGKNKKAKANGQTNKLSKNEKKKFAENAPKAEDILPPMEVKTLYTTFSKKSGGEKAKESPKTAPIAKPGKEAEKKAAKKPVTSQPAEKKKVPHGMEECLKALEVAELTGLIEGGKAQFPTDPSVWLRSLAAALNSKLPPNPWSDNPSLSRSLLALCPVKLNKLLLGVVRDIGPARQAFYENCLAAITNDMSKGSAVNGWLLLTEALSQVAPELAVSNTARWNSLMKSYQNRSNIGGALLWALGQAGLRSLPPGLQVWESVFLPAAELKSYTKLAVDSLAQMLSAAAKRGDSKESRVSPEQYDATFVRILTLVSFGAVSKELASLHRVFQDLALLSVDKNRMFLALLGAVNKVPSSHPLNLQILQTLAKLIQEDQASVVTATWLDVYRSHLVASASLLRHLHSQWSSYKAQLATHKFKEFLLALKVKTMDISRVKGADKEGMMECQRLTEDLLKKLNNMSGGFPWKTANVLLIFAIAGLAAFDINRHGSFQSSSTGIFLKETGVLYYGQKALVTTQAYCQSAYKWGEKELPPLWVQYGAPAWEVVKEQSLKVSAVVKAWAINVGNWLSETWPVVADFIEQYAPGLLGKCKDASIAAWGYTKHYSELGYSHAKNASISAITWVNTNVLVGQWSAENLSRVSLEAYNATQTFAIDTYHWIYQKVLPSTTTTKNA